MNKPTSPVPLMEITSGIHAFKALAIAVELGLFSELPEGGSTTPTGVMSQHGLQSRPTEMLLTACTSLGMLRRDNDDSYRNPPLSDKFLVKGKPHYFGDWITVVDRHEYPAALKLADSLRENHPAACGRRIQAVRASSGA
ncbi:methyltransferase family protein [Streptomyces fulvorobeus]